MMALPAAMDLLVPVELPARAVVMGPRAPLVLLAARARTGSTAKMAVLGLPAQRDPREQPAAPESVERLGLPVSVESAEHRARTVSKAKTARRARLVRRAAVDPLELAARMACRAKTVLVA